ncbi:hypothetical protein IMZ48_18580 [Candidatus Bathyarchaeota archaeon]|nr:hypothetical protein [Candidatus Bathyarchaeota archaeon]
MSKIGRASRARRLSEKGAAGEAATRAPVRKEAEERSWGIMVAVGVSVVG